MVQFSPRSKKGKKHKLDMRNRNEHCAGFSSSEVGFFEAYKNHTRHTNHATGFEIET